MTLRGTRTLVLAFVLVVAACGGSADSTTTTETTSTTAASAPTTVISDDGIIRIEVPADAGFEVTVGTVSEVPEEFEGLPLVGPVYELRPDRATFDTAVTITATFDARDVPGHPATLLLPVLLSSDGTLDMLGEIHVEVSEAQAIVTGTTEHFSVLTFVALGPEGDHGSGAQVAMNPPEVERLVGESFTAEVILGFFSAHPDQVRVDEWHFNPSVLAGGMTETAMGTTFTCIARGGSEYSADVQLIKAPLSSEGVAEEDEELTALEQLIKAVTEGRALVEVTAEITISGDATCVDAVDADALCPPNLDGVECGSIEVAGYMISVQVPQQAIDPFDILGCVAGSNGMAAAGMEIYFSTWRTGGSPGDSDAQHVGPLILGPDGCTMASFNGLPLPADVFTSLMGEVGQFAAFDADGMILFVGSP